MQALFLHGLGQGPASWDGVLSHLTIPLESVCPDLFAFCTGGPVTYSALYHAFCRYCGTLPRPLHLCGLSLGGILALHYGLEHPERTASLVLIGTPYTIPKAMLRIQNGVFHLLPPATFRGIGLEKGDILTLTRSMINLDFRRQMGTVTCPALILCGSRDRANRRAAGQLAQALPGAALELIPGSGHEVNVNSPAPLAALLDRFYQSLM